MAEKSGNKPLKPDDFLPELRQRFKSAVSESGENAAAAVSDLKFQLGGDNQWDEAALQARKGRPTLTVNKLPKFIRQVTGDQRQNRPGIQCRPVDDKADPAIARIIEGHIRNIQYNSFASLAYDNAFKHAVAGGYPGWWRVKTEYAGEDSFEQDITIDGVKNQFCVYPDPETLHEVYRGKLAWCFVTETMSEQKFKRRFPGRDLPDNWNQLGQGEEYEGWYLDGKITVAEYFYKETIKKTLYRLADGSTIDGNKIRPEDLIVGPDGGKALVIQGQPIPITKEREVQAQQVKWCLVTGSRILEGPHDWMGSYIPLVPVFGDTWTVEGKTCYKSLIRDSIDSQKAYNYTVSQNMEMAALQPKVPYKVTPAQIKGHEPQWNNLNNLPMPYVLYNPDAQAPGAPQREQGASVNSAFVQLGIQATEDLKDTMGIYDAGLGKQSNERSGVAIFARKQESDVGMYEFIDNYGRAHIFTGMILVDLIPKIYDTQRTIRTIGSDDTVQMAEINKTIQNQDGSQRLINDITVGKYDVFITVGPSYTTQRMQAAESMTKLIQTAPALMDRIGHLVVKSMDWPGAEKIAELLDPANQPKQENPALIELQGKLKKMEAEIEAIKFKNIKTITESNLNIAKAAAAEAGDQREEYGQQLEAVEQSIRINNPPPGTTGE